jgi:hypothetical protein
VKAGGKLSSVIFNGLYCVIFQKIVFFITTVVRTSNTTKIKYLSFAFI